MKPTSSDYNEGDFPLVNGHDAGNGIVRHPAIPMAANSPQCSPDMSIINRTQMEAPPFPVELLGLTSDWVRVAAASRSAPIDFVALGLITTVAGLLGPSMQVSPWEDWKEPSILWGCLVGAPSTNKSPAIDPLRAAVKDLERHAADATPSSKRRILISDVTTEKAAQLLAANPSGLICIRDELSALLGGFGRYGSSGADRAFWIESFGGRHHVVDRVKHEEPINIAYCGISVLGGIQPDRLASLLFAGDDDGLASRFIYAWPAAPRRLRPMAVLDSGLITNAFRRLYEIGLGREGEQTARVIMLESFAADEFGAWYEREKHDAWTTGLLSSALGKLEGIMLRISLVIEFLTWAVERRNEPAPNAISAHSVNAAIAIVEGWIRPTLQRVFAEASLAKVQRDAMTIARWLLKDRFDLINSRELRRTAGFPGPKDAKDLDAALDVLVDADWLMPQPSREGGSGRQRKDHRVNRLVYEWIDCQ